jgi:hypothetical protein
MRKLSYVLASACLVALVTLASCPDFVYAQANTWAKSVKGQVVFPGAVPQPKMLDVNKDQQHCLVKGPIVS